MKLRRSSFFSTARSAHGIPDGWKLVIPGMIARQITGPRNAVTDYFGTNCWLS
jgi:hypothetical protein